MELNHTNHPKFKGLSDHILATPGFKQTAFMADLIASRIIDLGWQWHPPVTDEIDLDFNKVALLEFPDPTPEQEVDIMDRIVSGLPVGPLYDVASLYPQEVDVVSAYPKEFLEPADPEAPYTYKKNMAVVAVEWRRIPEFDNYEMNREKVVRNRWTKRELDIYNVVSQHGPTDFVEMHNKEGFVHQIAVSFAFERTFV